MEMRASMKADEYDGKKKKEPTTKRLIIPASEIIRLIANDNTVAYPISLAVLDRNGGTSHQIDSLDELLAMARTDMLQETNLVRMAVARGTLYLDVMKEGWCVVSKDQFPEYNDKQMMMPEDIYILYITMARRIAA